MVCPHCKKEVPDGSNYCNYCGRPLYAKYTDGAKSIYTIFMTPRLRRTLLRSGINDLRELSRYDKDDQRINFPNSKRGDNIREELNEIMAFHGVAFYGEAAADKPSVNVPVDSLTMKNRLRDILRHMHISDLYELTRYTKQEIHMYGYDAGPATLKQLSELLSSAGLSFKTEDLEEVKRRAQERKELREKRHEEFPGLYPNSMSILSIKSTTRPRKPTTKKSKSTKPMQNRGEAWREKSVGFKWAIEQVQAGKPRKDIIQEFNLLHANDPENYSTSTGKCLSDAILSQWVKDAGLRR